MQTPVLLSPRRMRTLHRNGFLQRPIIKLCLAVFITAIVLIIWYSWKEEKDLSSEHSFVTQATDISRRASFEEDWCRYQRARIDWKAIISPCEGNTEWGRVPANWSTERPTSAQTTYIYQWDIKPAGEFSRFFIRSQTHEGQPKTVGGDAWRVHLSGPAYLSPLVRDHGNGSYEVLFLAMEHGKYQAQIVLDYSLCNGIRDPPRDWFIIGNAQGKGQRHPDVNKNRDFILDQLWEGTPVDIVIPKSPSGLQEWADSGAYFLFTRQPTCSMSCNSWLWEGHGRWVQQRWIPYVSNAPQFRDPHYKREGTLNVYGDSVSMYFADSIYHRHICRGMFKNCTKQYNWIYPITNYTVDKAKDDNLDFNQTRVLEEVNSSLSSHDMDGRSLAIINFGLHYVESVNFTTYQKLIEGLVQLFREYEGRKDEKEVDNSTPRTRARIIWKTLTAINKERASSKHLGNRRFFTYQRVLLFNTYANAAMCSAGINVLDVYPMSDSYPWGTGTHGSSKPVKNDVVHYSNLAFRAAEDLLESMFQG